MTGNSTKTMARQAAHRPARVGLGTIVAIGVVAVLGVIAGAYWHGPISARLGLHGAAHTEAPASGPQGRELWTCSMHPQVIQEKAGLCPICHMALTPLRAGTDGSPDHGSVHAGAGTTGSERKVAYWWDPMMSPPYIADKPGKSPMGMDLAPVYEDQVSGGAAVVIDPVVVQNMGVRVAAVTEGPLRRTVRAVGYLDQAQPNVRDINLRVSGWIEKLFADTEGSHLRKGDPLFDLYSPELQLAVEELIAAHRALPAADTQPGTEDHSAEALYRSAKTKLELWGLPPKQVEALAVLDRAPRAVTFVSPVEGDVTEKPIVEGAAVKAGDRVLQIVDRSTLWIDAQVSDQDVPFVHAGQKARAIIASRPGADIEGTVVFVDPRVDPTTRSTKVRLAVANTDLSLRPGMYATVLLESELAARATLVARETVIDAGDRQVAFIVTGVGRFEPRAVRTGLAGADGMVQVVSGLAPGETVVVSGQFLLDSESRLREAVRKYLGESRGAPQGATPRPSGPAAPGADDLVVAYLTVAERLGEPEAAGMSLDLTPLLGAAAKVRSGAAGGAHEATAGAIAGAAEAMAGLPLDKQRERFKALSDAVIALVESSPVSRTIGDRLFVAYCPMVPGHWLQRTDQVANPYYATSMKACGEIVRTIDAAPDAGGGAE